MAGDVVRHAHAHLYRRSPLVRIARRETLAMGMNAGAVDNTVQRLESLGDGCPVGSHGPLADRIAHVYLTQIQESGFAEPYSQLTGVR